jgi:hypothetical protein
MVFTPIIRVTITHRLCYFYVSTLHSELFLLLTRFKTKTIQSNPYCILVTFFMVPVVRLESNGCQDLLSHDDAVEDLKIHGSDVFLKKFEGYNLHVAKYFVQTFDGCRAKIGYTQLEMIEEFISKAIGLPTKGERWFKNA